MRAPVAIRKSNALSRRSVAKETLENATLHLQTATRPAIPFANEKNSGVKFAIIFPGRPSGISTNVKKCGFWTRDKVRWFFEKCGGAK